MCCRRTLSASCMCADGISPRDERSGAVGLALAVRRGGFPAASRNLARLYEANAGDPWFAGPFWNEVVAVISGWPSVPKDPLEAYDWFDRAASDGLSGGGAKARTRSRFWGARARRAGPCRSSRRPRMR